MKIVFEKFCEIVSFARNLWATKKIDVQTILAASLKRGRVDHQHIFESIDLVLTIRPTKNMKIKD